MTITLGKFGFVLTSREAGREALAAFAPSLADTKIDEDVIIDFDGVNTISPSWADEFLTPLLEKYGKRLRLRRTDNPSVVPTLKLLEKIHGFKFEVA
jgi:hypothetical protein